MICWMSEGITVREDVPNAAPNEKLLPTITKQRRKLKRFMTPLELWF
jgi:hypothetical protein